MTTKRLKRNQGRGEEGAQRAPMPAWIPRPVKRESGRTDPLRTPAHVRLIGVDLDDDEQSRFADGTQRQASRHGDHPAHPALKRVSVRLDDVSRDSRGRLPNPDHPKLSRRKPF
jgi:hypothetical protein